MEDKAVEDLTKEEIAEAIMTPAQPSVNELEETAEQLKEMGFRDINDVDLSKAMGEAMKNVQIQRTLQDITRKSVDKKSPKDYLEHHINFLAKISPNKTKGEIANSMTVEHALAALKTTAKMTDVPEAVIKKHLKTLRKKFN